MHDVDGLRDPATGLSRQWHFEIVLDFLFPIAHRGVTLTVALFGIDEGNWADDHANPDQVVTDLGSTIGGVTRNSDLVARFEEDTFICLLPLCNIQGGLVFAEFFFWGFVYGMPSKTSRSVRGRRSVRA